jgi:FdhD protein
MRDVANPPRGGASTEVRLRAFDGPISQPRFDWVATEEPLEVRLRATSATRTVAVTMRTPGNDFELAAGFLFAEGILAGRDALRGITYCIDREVDDEQRFNIVNVDLTVRDLPPLDALERHFAISSACGVCGKASLDALHARGLAMLPQDPDETIDATTLVALPRRLRAEQGVFDTTGGLHAAALFDLDGELVAVREDIGRHNALDKLLGWSLLEGRLPLRRHVVLVSGRASFELAQKAIAAGVPILAAVSAPSSLAIEVARAFGLTLAGFVRDERCNVYTGEQRVRGSVGTTARSSLRKRRRGRSTSPPRSTLERSAAP